MTNMRRLLSTPSTSLRMADGGNFLTRFITGTPAGKTLRGRDAAIEQAVNPPPPPAPPPAPAKPARTVADIRFKNGGTLRTGMGGHVPGEGEGDKIDAKYEPGEFVVSNDMLDAAPQLREQLSGLRGQVLAAKGMTPEEADAKSIVPGGLRAQTGIDPYVNHRAPNGPPISPPPAQIGYTPPVASTAVATTPYRPNFTYGDSVHKQPLTSPDFGNEAQARARAAAAARTAPPTPPAAADAPAPSPATGKLRGAANAAKGLAKGAALGAAGYGAARLVDGVGEGADGTNPETRANVLSIPTTTNEEMGRTVVGETPEYSFWQNTDLGRNVSNTLNALTPFTIGGTTALRAGSTAAKALNLTKPTALGVQQGANAVADENSAPPRTPQAAPTVPAAGAAPGLPAGTSLRSDGIYETRRPGQRVEFGDEASLSDIGFRNRGAISAQNMAAADALDARYAGERASLRNREQYDAEVAGAQRINEEGKVLAKETEAKMVKEKRQRSAQMTLGSITASDEVKAAAAAELKALDEADLQEGKDAAETARSAATNEVSLRNNQVNADVSRRNSLTDSATASATAQARKADDDRKYQLDVARLGIETANKNRDDKRASEAAFDKRIEGLAGTDVDGKPNLAAASQMRNAAVAHMDARVTEARELLAKDPNNKSAKATIEQIDRLGVGALGDEDLHQLLMGVKANSLAKKNDGWAINPWAGKAKNTNVPVRELRLERNMILPNQYHTDNGQMIPESAVNDNPDLLRLRIN